MPRIKRVDYRMSGPSWLLEGKARDHGQTAIYDPANFTEVIAKYKCIPSGYPVLFDARGNITPITAANETPDALVIWDQSAKPGTGKQEVAVLVHGAVYHHRLPKVIVGGEEKVLEVDKTKKTPLIYLYKEADN
jgi:hypothetical protein|nr:MAG TPA: hypothetical protein [Caudoviricetes sp.]DAU70391.1 MAG TPA: hypothetical protein [Caudoviricetes sp.]DAV48630.1 MAG TPA: hypothetical protein [Caudoviricetes sp.]DAV92393.1 MAG TPA: hypothetical protein [Caudoviricetes sp.]DAW11330.1 MAG TPA: hypothetical protein [Caudoviricetes sp.]